MSELYRGIDFVAAKEWWANTGDIDATFENLEAQGWLNTTFATVLSAMREEDTFNTTKILVSIGESLAVWQESDALRELDELMKYHIYLLEKNHSDMSDKDTMQDFIVASFKALKEDIESRNRDYIPDNTNDYSIKVWEKTISLKWFWEVFCAQFYKKLSDIRRINIGLLDMSSSTNNITLRDTSSPEKIFWDTLDFFRRSVWKMLQDNQNLIVPWYIWGIEWGIGDTIWEWYSDSTAALIAVVAQEVFGEDKKVILDILKSVPGIMTTDPRLLTWTDREAQVIKEMNFWIAKEIVWVRWAQAKLLNSYAMLPQVIRSGIDIRLRDPSNQDSNWTLISHDVNSQKQWVEAVLPRKDTAFISISSFSMNEGFIAKITQIVKKYASIDIIWTSETEFAFTVDMKEWITRDGVNKMIAELEQWYLNKYGDSIKKSFHNGLLFCVWHNMKKTGILEKASAALSEKWINVELVSQWIMQRALVLWVSSEQELNDGVVILHDRFGLS